MFPLGKFVPATRSLKLYPVESTLQSVCSVLYTALDTVTDDASVDVPAVRLKIFDVRGLLVRTLVDDVRPAGRHSAVWKGRDDAGRAVASGVYFYRISAGEYRATRRMVLLK